MFKKGQAAMEFLMTYGWAILVVLIAIGALAYFGVLNPSRFLPNSCTVSNQFACETGDFLANSSGVTIILRNGRGVDITNLYMVVNYTDATGVLRNCAGPVTPPTGFNITDGSKGAFSFECSTMPAKGGKFKGDIALTYTDSGSTLGPRVATGTVVTKVE